MYPGSHTYIDEANTAFWTVPASSIAFNRLLTPQEIEKNKAYEKEK